MIPRRPHWICLPKSNEYYRNEPRITFAFEIRRTDLLNRRPNPSAESMLFSAAAEGGADPLVGVTAGSENGARRSVLKLKLS